jgi:hypothetical protein
LIIMETKGWVTMTSRRLNQKNQTNQNQNPKPESMEQTILKMEKRWYQYEVQYDAIHGQGTYREKFVLPNVYPEVSESETESEEEQYYEDEWEPELDKWKEWN